jgi:NADPH-ferrihemoprotein reductase
LVVFCAATYGEGDPPENAVNFHEWLMDDERADDLMKGSRFSIFGLGDKTYEHFNKMGKVLDKRLEKLGAERVYARGEGDADGNIEEDFLKWKKQFWANVAQSFNVERVEGKVERKTRMVTFTKEDPAVATIDVEKLPRWRPRDPAAPAPRRRIYDAKNTYLAPIVVNRELHTSKSERSCRHIEIDIGEELHYEAGDHVGIFPLNDLTTVHMLAKRLGADLNQTIAMYSIEEGPASKVPIVGPCTLKAALEGYFELLHPPRKTMLRVLADYTQDEEEKRRLLNLASDDPDKQEEFNKFITHDNRTIYEVLKEFPGVKPPLDHFLEVLPKMQPRFYSISSSPNVHKGRVHVTAVVVEYKTPTGRIHQGVATTWLAKQLPASGANVSVPVFIRKSSFHLPAQLKNPIIMVGPGTGFAPFRGFLEERQFRAKKNNESPENVSNDLFFGCRAKDVDWLYREEMEAYEQDKTLSKLHLAFSREGEKKCYVQHLMTERAVSDRLWLLLNSGAYLYICGDAKNMARDVQVALRKAIMQSGEKTEKEADQFMESLSARGRSFSDVW